VLSGLIESWNGFYSNHAVLRTAIEFMHIGGLVAGGGCAITADLATITAARARSATLAAQLQVLKRTHHFVILGLGALVISGLLLLAADLETYLYSRIFWLKMGMMVVLLINGTLLVLGERDASRAEARAWTRLHFLATTSLVFWFLTTLAGAALSNLG
jgi:hypothetical protein